MRAAIYRGPGVIEIGDRPAPLPGAGEVLLKVEFCGICGTDLHEYESGKLFYGPERPADTVFGHEFSARVVALGPQAGGVAPGDLVTVNPAENCQECSFCLAGDEQLCQRPRGALGYARPGGLAEFTVAAVRRCVPLPPGTPADRAALSEPLAVALHAVNRAAPRPDETALVTGAGPIGQLTILALRQAGVERIIISEPAAGRRERARKLGVAGALDPSSENVGAVLKELTGGRGADLAFECVGIAASLDSCFAATRRGGRIVIAGVFQQPYPVNFARFTLAEHMLIGSLGYREEFAQAAALIGANTIDVSPVISHRVPLESAPAAFAAIVRDRGAYEKVLVQPSGP
ncbi:MAG TPA: alcohol dehydrogenase catalytic domain-containing protein [Dehalococcoidia bacterium]|nr:alcohol dehydrogenase catalytic domain-containing protein [Dehalococcoidia bacterium]